MRSVAPLIAAALLSFHVHARDPVLSSDGPFRAGQIWNVEVEAGMLSVRSNRHFDLRLQLGGLQVSEPHFYGLGLLGEKTFGLGSAGGVVASYSNSMQGVWSQLGGLIDNSGRPGFLVSTGFSLFGIEFQRRFASNTLARADSQWVVKLRLPISLLIFISRPIPL